jgi:hypothetical protein
MSHVDDGELTAYADGAYPVEGPEALRISAHLSTCDNCRTRLEQSQELRSRAAEILAFATPAMVPAPSFESLQTRVAATPRRTRPPIPLAWAATIVLALGIGWFGRGAWQTGVPAARSVAVQDAVNSAPIVVQEESKQTETVPAPAASTVAGARSGSSNRPTTAARPLAEADNAGADVAVGAAAGRVSAGNVAAAPPPPPPSVAAAEAMADREFVERRSANLSGIQYMTPAEAERRKLNVPRIPELPIARVGVNAGTTIIEQTLPDGKLITLTVTTEPAVLGVVEKTRAAAAAPAAQRAERAQNALVQKDGRTIIVAGDVSADSLRVLLEKVR